MQIDVPVFVHIIQIFIIRWHFGETSSRICLKLATFKRADTATFVFLVDKEMRTAVFIIRLIFGVMLVFILKILDRLNSALFRHAASSN